MIKSYQNKSSDSEKALKLSPDSGSPTNTSAPPTLAESSPRTNSPMVRPAGSALRKICNNKVHNFS